MTATLHKPNGRRYVERACRLHDEAMRSYTKGENQKAESLFVQALSLLETAEGPDHPDVAQALNNLASLYEDGCRYRAAERLYRRAVRIMMTIANDGDAEITRLRTQSWQNLGRIKQTQGRYRQAEPLFKKALALSEQVFGSGSVEVAEALNQLGMLCKYTGRFSEAGQHYQRALSILKGAHGSRDLALANVYHNLGGLEHASRNFARGEPYAREAVKIRLRKLGPNHPALAADLAALAALLDGQKKYREAEALYERALAIFERVYGEEHYEFAVNLNNLAAVYHAQGRQKRAEQLYLRALAIKEKIFGAEHPDVAMTLNNLAVFYKSTRQFSKAEELYRRAIVGLATALGPSHPHVPVCLDNYAELLHCMKRTEDAREIEARAMRIRKGLDLLTEDDVAVTGTINSRYARFSLQVRQSGIDRRGVFAEERIPSRRRVMEYIGERINRREAKRRSNERSSVYLYRLNKYWSLDGAAGGSGAEYVNHSCDPNLVTRIINGRIYYHSKRPIERGEELTIDYNFQRTIKKVPCHCGSAKCRGTINRVGQRTRTHPPNELASQR